MMVTDINKFSNNVMARQLLLTIDAELSKRPLLRPGVRAAAFANGPRHAVLICPIW